MPKMTEPYEKGMKPDWAICAADPKAPYRVGSQLLNRDGRRCGNACIIKFEQRFGVIVAMVLTDAGTTMRCTKKELQELFYTPKWIMKVDSCPGALGGR